MPKSQHIVKIHGTDASITSPVEHISIKNNDAIIVGREGSCDVLFENGEVSRVHLVVVPDLASNSWSVLDISSNGTQVVTESVRRLTKNVLSVFDDLMSLTVLIAGRQLTFHFEDGGK